MNPIDYALNTIKSKIPRQVLEACFLKSRGFGDLRTVYAVSLEHRIREDVVIPRVMVDANLVGGEDTHVDLTGLLTEHLPAGRTIWRIPLERTGGRNINKVDSLVIKTGATDGAMGRYALNQGSAVMSAVNQVMDHYAPIPNISHSEINLVGENVIMAKGLIPAMPDLYLKCTLENDDNFNNLPKTSYIKFVKLVELAVKSHIYNTLIINIDSAKLSGGRELGSFLNVVDSYADAEEMYTEYLTTTWAKIAILSDPESKRRHLEMINKRR